MLESWGRGLFGSGIKIAATGRGEGSRGLTTGPKHQDRRRDRGIRPVWEAMFSIGWEGLLLFVEGIL